MIRIVFFFILLSIAIGYALWRGNRDSRIVAFICLAGVALSYYEAAPISLRFASLETGIAIVDLAALAGFIAIALLSDRFWPMWVAGLQLTTVLGHLLKMIDGGLLPKAYGAALVFWSYPILVIIIVGTWRSYRRHLAEPCGNATLA